MEWNGTHYETVAEEGYDYDGTWELCKESEQEKQQRLALQNQQFQANQQYYNVDLPFQRDMAQKQMDMYMKDRAMEEAYNKQYMAMQQGQFDWEKSQAAAAIQRQQEWLAPIKATMTPYLTGDAYGPGDVARAQDAAMQDISSGYADAAGNTRAALLSRGGGADQPVGGDYARGNAELESNLANQVATSRRSIAQQFIDRNLQAKFAAAGVLAGGGAQMGSNIGTFNSGTAAAASGFGAGSTALAANPVTSLPGAPAQLAPPKPPGFWSTLGKGLLGQGLSAGMSFATGGLSNMFSSWLPKPPVSSPVGATTPYYGVGSGYSGF
jgi:hypothetical protein